MLEELTDEQKKQALGFEMWCCLEDSRSTIHVLLLELNMKWHGVFDDPSSPHLVNFLCDLVELLKLQTVYEREMKTYTTYTGKEGE